MPGNRTLAELHVILQHAFGWSDEHLHLFSLRGQNYGEPSPEDIEPILDEKKFRLDELKLRGRSRIVYMYYFGDERLHELVVQTSLPVHPEDPDVPDRRTAPAPARLKTVAAFLATRMLSLS